MDKQRRLASVKAEVRLPSERAANQEAVSHFFKCCKGNMGVCDCIS